MLFEVQRFVDLAAHDFNLLALWACSLLTWELLVLLHGFSDLFVCKLHALAENQHLLHLLLFQLDKSHLFDQLALGASKAILELRRQNGFEILLDGLVLLRKIVR